MDKNIGKKLDGRYEITELIGVGGMADVYKATDIFEDKVVAVKILKPEFSSNEDFIRRFRNESKAIAVLSHTNIVKIFDVGFSDKIQFIVMEYIDGITLKEFMEQQGVIKWKDSIHFIIQVLRALQHAHDRGIVHRDIKPQNIMLFPDGTIRVMDFGIARFAREEGKTISDKAIGSVHYISPEQARGDLTDEKSDIYSVGVLLYEMLTGEKPFDADNPVTIALMHMQNEAKNPKEINDSIPEGLEEIVIRAMQKEPSARYQSASEMTKDIEEFKRNPSITFEYKYISDKTQYFNTAAVAKAYSEQEHRSKSTAKNADIRPKKQNPSQKSNSNKGKTTKTMTEKKKKQNDYNYEDDRVSKSSYFVVILTAITAVILIIIIAFIAVSIMSKLGGEDSEVSTMPNLIGLSYDEVKTYYQGSFELKAASQEFSSEYPEGAIIGQTPAADRDYLVGKASVEVVVSKGPRMVVIPNVYEISSEDARAILENNEGFNVIIKSVVDENIEKNQVVMTDPERYQEAEYGSTVYLYVSRGPEVQEIFVPDLLNQNIQVAQENLKNKLTIQIMRSGSDMPKDTIIAQSLPALLENGQPNKVALNTTIILTVSTGEKEVNPATISFGMPYNMPSGSVTFNCYINGIIVGTTDVDNIAYATNVSVDITGSDICDVMLEAVNKNTQRSDTIAQYSVDFNEDIVTEIYYNASSLRALFDGTSGNGYDDNDDYYTPPEEVIPVPNIDDVIDYGDPNDVWDDIFNGR